MKTTTRQNTKTGLKNRTQQSSTERPQIDLQKRSANRELNTDALLALMRREAPGFFDRAEVIGKWVWIQFEQKQPSEVTRVLAELGFHWNSIRQAWQHPCGTSRDATSPTDPRSKYGSYFAADAQAA